MPCVTTCKPNLSSLILHKHDHNNNNNSKSNVSSNKKSRTFHHQQEKLKDHIVALIRTAVMLAGKGLSHLNLQDCYYRNPSDALDSNHAYYSNSVKGLSPYISSQICLLLSEEQFITDDVNYNMAPEELIFQMLEMGLYSEQGDDNYRAPNLQGRCHVIQSLAACGLPVIASSAIRLICRDLCRLIYYDNYNLDTSCVGWDWVAVNNILLLDSLIQISIQQGCDGNEILHIITEECSDMLIPTPMDSLPVVALADMKIESFSGKVKGGLSMGGKLMLRMELLELTKDLVLLMGS